MKIIVEAQGTLLKLSQKLDVPYREQRRTSTRGAIKGFSTKSRIRLLQLVVRLRIIKKLHPTFLTLTYGKIFPDSQTAKKYLWNFIKRLRRRSPEVFSYIWRLELQDRDAPHFHLIIFNMPFIHKATIQKLWAECVSEQYWDYSAEEVRYPFTRIETIRNHKKLCCYVSKYIAKKDDASPEGDASSCGFNNAPYLSAQKITGRLCGVINKAILPFAKISQVVIDYDKNGTGNFRICAGIWNGIEDYCGFHLYTSNLYSVTYILSRLFVDRFKIPIVSEIHESLKMLPCEPCPF